MQVKYFKSGGFVIHKAKVCASDLTFSIWCNDHGQMLDVEAFLPNGKQHAPFTVRSAKGIVGEAIKLLCFRVAAANKPTN